MRRLHICLLALAFTSALVTGSAAAVAQTQPAEALLYQENFDRGTASGWQLEPGWRVSDGALLGEGHQWARLENSSWRGYRLQARVKLLAGRLHINYRFSGDTRYFVGVEGSALTLSKQAGERVFLDGLARGATPVALGSWHQVEVSEQGGHLRVWLDGRLEIDYADPDPISWGGLAFETLDGSAAMVDDVVVYGSPSSVYSQETPWVRTGGPPGGIGYDIRMRPDNPDVMFVTDGYSGIFKSTDGGASWYPSNEGITARGGETGDAIPVFCATIDPNNPDIVWIGMQNTRGVYKSTDGGRSWAEKVNGIAEKNGVSFRGFTVDPRSSDIVYAAAEISSMEWAGEWRRGVELDLVKGVVYKTTDGGASWTAIWRGDNLARHVWLDPRDPDVVYVSTGIFDREAANSNPASGNPGGEGVLKSVDGGRTWTNASKGYTGAQVRDLAADPALSGRVIAAARSGVFASDDGGGDWVGLKSMPPPLGEVTAVAIDPADGQHILLGNNMSDFGLVGSRDSGLTWQEVAPRPRLGIGWRDIAFAPSDPSFVYAGTGVYSTPSTFEDGAPALGIYASRDGGATWRPANDPSSSDAHVTGLAIHPGDPLLVYAATTNRGVLRSTDGGQSWSEMARGLPGRARVHSVAVHPRQPDVVFCGLDRGGVYRTEDGGSSWKPFSAGLNPEASVTHILFDPTDPSLMFLADRRSGAYGSTDGGATWSVINEGLLNRSVNGLAISPDGMHLYAATEGGGVFRLDLRGIPPTSAGG